MQRSTCGTPLFDPLGNWSQGMVWRRAKRGAVPSLGLPRATLGLEMGNARRCPQDLKRAFCEVGRSRSVEIGKGSDRDLVFRSFIHCSRKYHAVTSKSSPPNLNQLRALQKRVSFGHVLRGRQPQALNWTISERKAPTSAFASSRIASTWHRHTWSAITGRKISRPLCYLTESVNYHKETIIIWKNINEWSFDTYMFFDELRHATRKKNLDGHDVKVTACFRSKNRNKDSSSNFSFLQVLAQRLFTENWPPCSLLQLTHSVKSSQVKEWRARFATGDLSCQDQFRTGRPPHVLGKALCDSLEEFPFASAAIIAE
jgi:hypothetical protein